MKRSPLERFANAQVTARHEPGFLSSKWGWVPYLDGVALLSAETGPDGLFSTETEAVWAGERYRRKCRAELEVAP